MADWLPRDWEVKDAEGKAQRALAAVRVREARRRRAVRAAGAAAAFVAGSLFLTLLYLPGPWKGGSAAPASPAPLRSARARAPEAAKAERLQRALPKLPAPKPAGREAPGAARGEVRPSRQSPQPAEGVPRLVKAGGAVLVTWSGDPRGEYVVYKCESPAFDACTRKAEVKGTSWSDGERDRSPIVFYKVERKA